MHASGQVLPLQSRRYPYGPAHLHKIHTYRNGELHSETSAKPRHDV